MARRGTGFDLVRMIGLELPGVEESTMYGAPALKLHGKLVACMASHKSAEPGSLAVRIDFDQRDSLLEDDPRTYYITAHYQDYAAVLVRLHMIERDALHDLLHSAWRFVSSDKPRVRRRSRRT